MISVKSDLREVTRWLSGIERKQIPFATMNTLNNLAFASQRTLRTHMERVFDNPVRYTVNSTKVQKASKNHLTARVWIKDKGDAGKGVPPSEFLLPHIRGGGRNAKSHELALRRIGILPYGWFAIYGIGADIDAFGNMKRRQLTQILAYFQAFGRYSGDNANMTAEKKRRLAKGTRRTRGRAYFAAIPGRERTKHLLPGIYMRESRGSFSVLKPVLIFVNKVPQYTKEKLDFYGVQDRYVRRHFRPVFEAELRRAIATAR